jgi:hypothetical protein
MTINQKMLDKWGSCAPMIETITKNPVALIPGYSLYEWFKEDKSKIWPDERGLSKMVHNSLVYTGAAVRDAGLALIYYGIGGGLVKLAEESAKLLR